MQFIGTTHHYPFDKIVILFYDLASSISMGCIGSFLGVTSKTFTQQPHSSMHAMSDTQQTQGGLHLILELHVLRTCN